MGIIFSVASFVFGFTIDVSAAFTVDFAIKCCFEPFLSYLAEYSIFVASNSRVVSITFLSYLVRFALE